MTTIRPTPATGSLATPFPREKPKPLPDPKPPAAATAPSDTSEVPRGKGVLQQVATTPLWSADFELPVPPAAPALPAYSGEGAWEIPQVRSDWTGFDPAHASDAELKELLRAYLHERRKETPSAEEEADLNLLEMMTWPMRTLSAGAAELIKAWYHTWRGIGQTTGTAIKHVAGAVGHGIQQVGHMAQGAAQAVGHAVQGAAHAVGDAATKTWNAIANIRLW